MKNNECRMNKKNDRNTRKKMEGERRKMKNRQNRHIEQINCFNNLLKIRLKSDR